MRAPAAILAAFLAACSSAITYPAAAEENASSAARVSERVDPRVALEDVRLALRGSKELPAGAVTAVVHADTIVLTGEVSTESQAARALAVAEQNSQGVRVASHLNITGSRPEPAQVPELVRVVEAALRADSRTRNLGVVVSIDAEDVIGLHGLVPSKESRAAAEQVARGVEGVQRVSSRLVVAGE
jgi:osmotically-inducible protein OsmY